MNLKSAVESGAMEKGEAKKKIEDMPLIFGAGTVDKDRKSL